VRIRPRLLGASLLAAVVVVAIFAWTQRSNDDLQPDATLQNPGSVVTFPDNGLGNDDVRGEMFPDVVLLDRDGAEVATADLLGQPLVVNLWFSTCPPCAKELPDFAEVDAQTDDVRFIGVNTLDSVEVMERFAGDRGVEYELFRDEFAELGDNLYLALHYQHLANQCHASPCVGTCAGRHCRGAQVRPHSLQTHDGS